ncbi:MAG TPA: ABC transporter permease, partial [Pirellulaceae bacterium]|nr:ABC transporter permease [Pirellulaceae bacterium]
MGFTTIIYRNVWRRKMRSLLTVLGVTLAITAVVALLGVTSGFTQSLLTMYENRGVDLVVVRAGVADRLTSTLSEPIGKRIEALPHVKAVAASLTELDAMPIRGWQPDSFAFDHLALASGRRLERGDVDGVLLGMGLAAEKGKKVGDTFEVGAKPFTVVGIFDAKSPIENSAAVMLLADLQKLMDRPEQVTEFQIAMQTIAGEDKALIVDELRRKV